MYNENPLLLNPFSFITSPFQSFTPKIPIKMDPKVEFIYSQMQTSLEREVNHISDEDKKSFSSCIFKVPQSLLEINKEAYQPQIVSIGPYHHGTDMGFPIHGKEVASAPYHEGKDLPMIREQKWRYLNGLLKEMQKEKRTNEPLKYLINSIVSMEKEIRQSYSETISDSSEDLAMMMVLDGVFLIELFRKFGNIKLIHQNDPIFKMVWVLPFLMRDFLRMENQIPFFVLQTLFDESQTEKNNLQTLFDESQTEKNNRTLPSLILKFFNYEALRPKEVLREYDDLNGEHLLDLFRKTFLIKKTDASIGNGTPGHVTGNQELHTSNEGTSTVRNPQAEETGERYNSVAWIQPEELRGETSSSIGNRTFEDVNPIVRAQPEKMQRNDTDTAALYGNETSNESTSMVCNPQAEETGARWTFVECIQPEETHVLTSPLIGNRTFDNDNPIVRVQPAKMQLNDTFTAALYGNEMSNRGTSMVYTNALYGNKTSNRGTSMVRTAALYGNKRPKKTAARYGSTTMAARYGNRTLNKGTSTVRNEPEKTHPKVTVANNRSFERIQSATKLVVAGVKFKKNDEAKSFLDIKFQKGVLFIPQINLDDFYTHFILNGMIFEQCYSDCSKDITTYIVFLGCLINTSMDVGLLSDKKIIQNYLGTDKELVKFFNNVVKYVAFGVEDNYLKEMFKEINDYCDNGWHVVWAGFKHTYFDSPWTFISALAAFVLLCLTIAQTIYTVYPYYNERI